MAGNGSVAPTLADAILDRLVHSTYRLTLKGEPGGASRMYAASTACRRRRTTNRKARFGGMEAADIKRLKHLEEENRHLKQMFADLSLENRTLKDVIRKKLQGQQKSENWWTAWLQPTT